MSERAWGNPRGYRPPWWEKDEVRPIDQGLVYCETCETWGDPDDECTASHDGEHSDERADSTEESD